MLRIVFLASLIFLILAESQSQGFTSCAAVTGIDQSDCEALVTLYNSTGGPNWTNTTGWLQTDTPCSWYGVTCNLNRVTSLSLGNRSLTGILELNLLPELTYIDFSYNSLTGVSFATLPKIDTINLEGNQLIALPDTLGNLVTLRALYGSRNQLITLPETIGSLTNLKFLYIDYNQLTTLPMSFGNLSSLESLSVRDNQLTTLPDSFGNLTNLHSFWANHNQLVSLPDSFGNLSSLSVLLLNNNQLTVLPASFANLAGLTLLYLDHNKLVTLPDGFGNYPVLTSVYLSQNRLTSLPASIGNMVNISALPLDDNLLTILPDTISNLSKLSFLNVYNNNLIALPDTIGNATALENLRLDYNDLTTLPGSIANLNSIHTLSIENNRLTEFPPINGAMSLNMLYLNGNQIMTMPSWFIKSNFPNLSVLYIDYNGLVVTDPAVAGFIDEVAFTEWRNYQIVAPTDFYIKNYNTTTSEITFGWTPIAFSNMAGEYIIGCGSTPENSFDHYVVSTFDKHDSQIEMLGLLEGTYYCAIKTQNHYNSRNFNVFASAPSEPVQVNITTPPVVINDKPRKAAKINQTQYGYFLGEFNQATAETMPVPAECGVTPDMKSVFFKIPRAKTTSTRGPGRYVSGRSIIETGGSGHFVEGNAENTDTIMAVYRRTVTGGWKFVSCNDNASADGASRLDFNVKSKFAYRIVVWGKEDTNLESLILQSVTPNVVNNGAEKNKDAEPLLPDNWITYDVDYNPAAPEYSVIQCDPAQAHTGNCYALIQNASWTYLRIPVSPRLATANGKFRFSAYIRRQNLMGNAPIRLSLDTNQSIIDLESGHDENYWKIVSDSVYLSGDNLYIQIHTPNLTEGSLLIDDIAVEMQLSDGTRTEWMPLPMAP